MKFWVSVILVLLHVTFAAAEAVHSNPTDTFQVDVKKFSADKLSVYKADKDFDYHTTPVKEESFLSLVMYYLTRLVGKMLSIQAGDISLYDVLIYGLMFFAAGMIVYQLFKVQISGFFNRDSAALITSKTETENILETDFDKLIELATGQRDFRLATRLFYLKTLRVLTEAGFIRWQQNKTNFDYYYELKGDNVRKQFYGLTVLFESSWYGNTETTAEMYTKNTVAFNTFLQTIKR